MMRGLKAAGLVALILLPSPLHHATVPPDSSSTRSSLRIVRGRVEPDTPLASILAPELSAAAVHALVEVARPLYDLARVDPGRPFGLARTNNGLLLAFTYGIDDLRTLRVSRQDGTLESEIIERSYDAQRTLIAGQIDSSLFLAVARLGESDQLALDLAEIFVLPAGEARVKAFRVGHVPGSRGGDRAPRSMLTGGRSDVCRGRVSLVKSLVVQCLLIRLPNALTGE